MIIGVRRTECTFCVSPEVGRVAYLAAHLLGPLQVTLDGKPVTGFESDKARALLAYLIVEAERPHRREKLAGFLWPERPEQAARANLRRVLANLRQVLGDRGAVSPFLSITPQTLQLDATRDLWSDVAAFSTLQSFCLRPRSPLGQDAIDQMEQAVALYRGNLLEGFSFSGSAAFEEWVLLNRERYRRLAMQVLRLLAAYYGREGEHELALQYAWRQVEMDPWQEEAHLRVMRLLVLNGQRCAALAQYEACRRLLSEELGIEPAEETTRLYERIRSEGRLGNLADYD